MVCQLACIQREGIIHKTIEFFELEEEGGRVVLSVVAQI